jgi:hypothetical protein
MADSAAFCQEQEDTMTYFPLSAGRDKSFVLNVAHLFLGSLLLPPMLHQQLLTYKKMSYIYVSLHVYHTHTSCFFKLFNNLVDSGSQWRNMIRKLDNIFFPQQHKNYQEGGWGWWWWWWS